MKKYAVHPGWVISMNDKDRHWVSFCQLTRLYGVNPRECFTWNDISKRGRNPDDYIHLYPRSNGDYRIIDHNSEQTA